MNEMERRKLRQLLFEAIEKWSEDNADDYSMYWGDKTTGLMADAAFSVFEAVADVQEYMEAQGIVKAA